ncbi:MAG: DUF4159 domain-containing protein [Tepidisphaeraceae bacterium]
MVIDENERNGVPLWDVPPAFKSDLFTFVRIRYNSVYGRRSWYTDFPDSDLNFSFRLQQMTSLKVDPKGKILDLTDEKLFDYPFIYMLEVGSLEFSEEEITAPPSLSVERRIPDGRRLLGRAGLGKLSGAAGQSFPGQKARETATSATRSFTACSI